LHCYYAANPSEVGYRKRPTSLWHQRNPNSNYTEQHLCGQALSLLKRKYFSELELNNLKSQIQPLSTEDNNHSVCLEAVTVNTAAQQVDNTNETSENLLTVVEPDAEVLEVQQFPLTQYQSKLLDKLLYYIEDLQTSPRSYLPPLCGRKLLQLSTIISDMNVVLLCTSAVSLTELSNLYYCAACVVLDECGMSISCKSNTAQQSVPPWEIRLRIKLQKLQKDLSWLCEFNTGHNLNLPN